MFFNKISISVCTKLFSTRHIPVDNDESEVLSNHHDNQHSNQQVVTCVARVGSGLWVAFEGKCTISLYYLHTLTKLQEVNLARNVQDFVAG